jgi:hypothetical protein
MPVERLLSGSDSGGEIVVIEGWVDDGMAVILQVGRFDAARYAVPAVEEENGCHLNSLLIAGQHHALFPPHAVLASIAIFGKVCGRVAMLRWGLNDEER